MYLRNLTNEELLRYAQPVTELEKELVRRLEVITAYDDDCDGCALYAHRRSAAKI